MSLRTRLEPYTNLNNLRALDHQDRKQLSTDIRDLLAASRCWLIAAVAGAAGATLALGAIVGMMLHGR